ncbi:MAG: adenosylmethionine decarboxylase [Candidatus Nitrosocaldus sp.]
MGALGYNIFADMYGCDNVLDDVEYLRGVMKEAAIKGNMSIVRTIFHRYETHGVTGVVIVKESHLAIHTWPEYSFASVDIFLCGTKSNPYEALRYIELKLRPKKVYTHSIERGMAIEYERIK